MIRVVSRPLTAALPGLKAGHRRAFAESLDATRAGNLAPTKTQEWLVIIPDKPGVVSLSHTPNKLPTPK